MRLEIDALRRVTLAALCLLPALALPAGALLPQEGGDDEEAEAAAAAD